MADVSTILLGLGGIVTAAIPGLVALRNSKRQEKETTEAISAKAFEQAEKFYENTLQRYREELNRAQAALAKADEQLEKYRSELSESQYKREWLQIQVNHLEQQKVEMQKEIDDLRRRMVLLEAELKALPPKTDEGQ